MEKKRIFKIFQAYFKHFIAIIAIVLTFGFFSCSDDEKINDEQAPEIHVTSPESEGVYVTIDDKITIAGIASDDKGLTSITWANSNGKTGQAEGLENWTIKDLELANGENKVVITATDKGGNKTEAQIIIQKNKYINYLGMPKIDPPAFFSGSSTGVRITSTIIGGENFVEASVKLIEVDANGNYIGDICNLHDSGNLNSNGDEIKGDNIFSAKYAFNIAEAGKKYYRVQASSNIDGKEVLDYSPILTQQIIDKDDAEAIAKSLYELHQKIEVQLKTLEGNSDKGAVINEMLDFIKKQVDVTNAKINGDYIEIEHVSGLVSYVYESTPTTQFSN